ncbi:Hypothetical protein NTJ_09868 [Nesidiocoris tenuis]|uniref:Uncharacterized protein n=1 Tax=Nesidiocoris tenuis TaxID=355587 RepID=A0ABN7AZS0_9HEMI|nr:Hypothetical protein NTJ_09868 [Nesidiocoris tenuis]
MGGGVDGTMIAFIIVNGIEPFILTILLSTRLSEKEWSAEAERKLFIQGEEIFSNRCLKGMTADLIAITLPMDST